MRLFSALMPREGQFFDLFNQHANFVNEGGQALTDLLDNYADEAGRAARINRKLTARAGTWGSDVDTSVSYSWYACKKAVGHVSASLPSSAGCRSIAGQHSSTFKIAKKYKRSYILAAVTVSNEFGSTTRYTRTTLRVR